MTSINQRGYLVTLTIFLLGGGFASLLMYYSSRSKNLLGLYNESIFMVAVFFVVMAAISLMVHHAIRWWNTEPPCEPKRECE
jgi:hypothetical protein